MSLGKIFFILIACEYAAAAVVYFMVGDWKHGGVALGYSVSGFCFVMI